MSKNTKESEIVSQVKKINLYGIELDAERTEFLSMSEQKKYELDKLDFAKKTDDLLDMAMKKNIGRSLIPSNSEDRHNDFMATVQSMNKRLQK